MIVDEVRQLRLDLQQRHARAVVAYELSTTLFQRSRARLADSRRSLQRVGETRAVRRLQTIINGKIDQGLLPTESAPRIYGAPGIGGPCDACDKTLAPTQLVMSVPWPRYKTFAHLHADCFMAWNAVRRRHDIADWCARHLVRRD